MILKKLPAPWRITFDTNPDLCNLNCIMCDTHSPYAPNDKNHCNRIMPINTVRKVVDSIPNGCLKEIIPSTMGEPLLYPYFDEMVSIIKSRNVKLNLTTNGTFPKHGVEEWCKLLFPVLSDMKISINGYSKKTAESIMKGLNFNMQIKNLEYVIEYRDEWRKKHNNPCPTITIQTTFMKRNIEELPDLLELAINLGVDRLKGHHVWVVWDELRDEYLLSNDEGITLWNSIVDELYKIKRKHNSNIKLDNIYKINAKNDNHTSSIWMCPFLGREAWISWNGDFNICCAPDELRKTFGKFGNVNESNFMELWNSKKYNEFIHKWGDNPVCKECNMKRPINI